MYHIQNFTQQVRGFSNISLSCKKYFWNKSILKFNDSWISIFTSKLKKKFKKSKWSKKKETWGKGRGKNPRNSNGLCAVGFVSFHQWVLKERIIFTCYWNVDTNTSEGNSLPLNCSSILTTPLLCLFCAYNKKSKVNCKQIRLWFCMERNQVGKW